MSERPSMTDEILSYLRGGSEIDVFSIAKNDPETLARSVAYILPKNYHRENLVKAVVALINKSPPTYRGVAWSLIQQIPLSHILYIPRVIRQDGGNSRRLRHAVVNKIVKSSRFDIIRSFFIATEMFRELFSYLYLPRRVINGKEIKNENYLLAVELSELSVPEAMETLKLTPVDLVKNYKIPIHMVMKYIDSPEMASELTGTISPDDFFRHGRWFRDILGDEKYEKIAMRLMKQVRDPLSFISIKDHLEATGALTFNLVRELDKRVEKVLDELMQKHQLERLALIVDVSGSMNLAKDITIKLYNAFSRMSSITDLIAFNNQAFTIELDRLRELEPMGMTSIGSAFVLLAQRLSERTELPQAIVLVTDLEENTPPFVENTIQLMLNYDSPPLIILHCGGTRKNVVGDYPHAVIPVKDFHPRLLTDIMAQFARLTEKVAVKEKEITRVVKERKPLDEELGTITLPERPKETLVPGYLERLLTSP